MSSPERLATVTSIRDFPSQRQPAPAEMLSAEVSPLVDHAVIIDNEVIEPRIHHFDGGSIQDRTYTLSDGSGYNAAVIRPDQARFDIAATLTPPWCTDTGGFNTDIGKHLARAGMPSVIVSPEQSGLVRSFKKLVRMAFSHDADLMAFDAEAHLLILDEIDKDDFFRPDVNMNPGYSRGSMVGFGLQAYSGNYGRLFAFSDYTDPCVEHKVERDEVELKALPGYFAVEEPRALVKSIGAHRISDLHTLRRSLRLAPGFWVNQVATGFTIFRGEAGTFIDHLPKDSATFVQLFNSSRFNHAASYQDRLAPYPNIETKTDEGYHLSGAHPDVYGGMVLRLTAAQNLVKEGTPVDKIRTTAVLERAGQQAA